MSSPDPDSLAEFLAVAQEMTAELARQHQEQLSVMRLSAAGMQTAADQTLIQLKAVRQQGVELAKVVPQWGQTVQTSLQAMATQAGQTMAQNVGGAFGQGAKTHIEPAVRAMGDTSRQAQAIVSEMQSYWRTMVWTVVVLATLAAAGLALGTWLYLDVVHENQQLRQRVSDYAAAYQALKAEKAPKPKASSGVRE